MYRADSGGGFTGGQTGHAGQGACTGQATGSGFGGTGAHAANSTIAATKVLRMWVIYLEILFALALAGFIVWWTWPKKRRDDDQ
jgi:hypothetical protein